MKVATVGVSLRLRFRMPASAFRAMQESDFAGVRWKRRRGGSAVCADAKAAEEGCGCGGGSGGSRRGLGRDGCAGKT